MFFRKKVPTPPNSSIISKRDIVERALDEYEHKLEIVQNRTKEMPRKAYKESPTKEERLELAIRKEEEKAPWNSLMNDKFKRYMVKYTVNHPKYMEIKDYEVRPIVFTEEQFEKYDDAHRYFMGLVQKYNLELEDHHYEI